MSDAHQHPDPLLEESESLVPKMDILDDHMHDFFADRVGNHKKEYHPVSVRVAVGSFLGIIAMDLIAVIYLFMVFVPPDAVTQVPYNVNASQAQAGRPECVKWTDVTQYPDGGLPLRQFADYATFFISSAQGKPPLDGSQLHNATLDLKCVAPDIPQTAADGATMALVTNLYGAWTIVGATQSPCKTEEAPQLVAYSTANDFGMNCQAATERAKTMERKLRSSLPNVDEFPEIWATDCKIKNPPNFRRMMFRTWWYWPELPDRPGFYGSVHIFCDGLAGVQQDFQQTYYRAMTDDELNTYTTTNKLCTQQIGTDCVFFYSYRKWGKTQWEHVRIAYDQLDCSNYIKFSDKGYPQWVLDQCTELQKNTSSQFVGMAMYRHLQDPSASQTLGGSITIATMLLEKLFASPRSQTFPDISYLPLSCPGRVSNLSDAIYSGSLNGTYNLRTLTNIMSQYDMTPMFHFHCEVHARPSFMQRLAYIWPYLSVIHTIVMTYAIRYVYLGLVAINNQLYDPEDRAMVLNTDEEASTWRSN